jgi:arylsulfatase A-like enzyme
MSDRITTLAESLSAAGYDTAAFTEGGYAKGTFGLDQGFDSYPTNPGDEQSHASNVLFPSRLEGNLERALSWLQARHETPFFLFFHTYEPHEPYRAPVDFVERIRPGWSFEVKFEHDMVERALLQWNQDGSITAEEFVLVRKHLYHCRLAGMPQINDEQVFWNATPALKSALSTALGTPVFTDWITDLYDAEVAFTDHRLALLWEEVQKSRPGSETILAITSDHGEGLGDHGEITHGQVLFEEILRVPLMMCRLAASADAERKGSFPIHIAPRRISELVRTLDVMPTVLELLGIPIDNLDLQGRSLVPLLGGGDLGAAPAFSQALSAPETDRFQALRSGRWRLIAGRQSAERWLFDLEADPEETRDVSALPPEVLNQLEAQLNSQIAANEELLTRLDSSAMPSALPQETVDELKALGYLGGPKNTKNDSP